MNGPKRVTSGKPQQKQEQPAKQLGMTSAISLALAKPEELLRTEELNKSMVEYNVFETTEELEHRLEVLAKLNIIFKDWVRDISIRKKMPVAAANRLGAKIYTFGSYRLGVHQQGADIDALCVAPLNIERGDFFSSFYKLLKQKHEVSECRSIEEAFVPVIKLKFERIEFDLLFARLALKELPDYLDLRDDKLLRNLDQQSVRSLNGCRVTDEILNSVPNIEAFRLTLRAIKLWAKSHGIYSNALGYFGGVTWALLVARVCQLYPNATASTLVHKFFLIFSHWKWPLPVLLKPPGNNNFLRYPVWDPRVNATDRYHLMPVITPAYPQQNSTFNVSDFTKKVIIKELERGKAITDDIMLGRASWDYFFQPSSFFHKYRHFIVLLASAQNFDDHVNWSGLVESKLRWLILNLERNQHILFAHVNPKCFNYKLKSDELEITSAPFSSMWFIGLEFEHIKGMTVNLTETIINFAENVNAAAIKSKVLKEGMQIDVRHVKRQQLSQYLDKDFLKRDKKLMEQEMFVGTSKRIPSESEESEKSNGKRQRLNASYDDQSSASTSASSSPSSSSPRSDSSDNDSSSHNTRNAENTRNNVTANSTTKTEEVSRLCPQTSKPPCATQ